MIPEIENITETSSQWLDALSPNPWVAALILVVAGLIVAKLADLVLVGLLSRILAKTENRIDDTIAELLHKPVFTSLAVTGLIVAAHTLSDQLGDKLLPIVLSLLKSMIILSWVLFFLRATGPVLSSMESHKSRFKFAQKDTVPLIRNLAMVLLVLTGAYAILVAWDINVTGFVASAGIVGLALSFAAQDTLSHLFAGVAILADRPYRIGDYIVLDTGERGAVTAIGLRTTRLMTRDDVEVSIPNGVMGSAKIVNESGGGDTRYRIRVSVGVAYGSDVDHVLSVLEGIALANNAVCRTPEPRVRFRAFGHSSLDFELLAWIIEPSLRGLLVHELNCAIYRRFTEEKIVIPFPQQDVWVRQLPDGNRDVTTPKGADT
jgi:small-conductance mechanosensitive channel